MQPTMIGGGRDQAELQRGGDERDDAVDAAHSGIVHGGWLAEVQVRHILAADASCIRSVPIEPLNVS